MEVRLTKSNAPPARPPAGFIQPCLPSPADQSAERPNFDGAFLYALDLVELDGTTCAVRELIEGPSWSVS
jgi:hypothetical protein